MKKQRSSQIGLYIYSRIDVNLFDDVERPAGNRRSDRGPSFTAGLSHHLTSATRALQTFCLLPNFFKLYQNPESAFHEAVISSATLKRECPPSLVCMFWSHFLAPFSTWQCQWQILSSEAYGFRLRCCLTTLTPKLSAGGFSNQLT